jgi:hypothetical protein
MNLCRACNKNFGSLGAFDAHRVGKHELDYPEYENGRRCLSDEEMTEGWHTDKYGKWRQDGVGLPFWATKSSAQNPTNPRTFCPERVR